MLTEQENTLVNLLWQVKEVLDKYNIEFWLDCGTLLGAVRNRKFLAWEHDIDLGIWHKNFSDNLKISIFDTLCERGFKVHISKLVNHMHIRKGRNYIDINFYQLVDNKAIWPMLTNPLYKLLNYFAHVLSAPYDYEIDKKEFLTKRIIRKIVVGISRTIPSFLRKSIAHLISSIRISNNRVLWIIPSSYFLNLSTIKFYGMEIKVPAEREEYLAYRYGKDWRIPRKNWVTSRDDETVKFRQR